MRWIAAALICAPLWAHAGGLRASVFDHLAGSWLVQGTVMGAPICNSAQAEWVLDNQFMRLTVHSLHEDHPYDAMIFLGMDGTDLSAHWLDRYGAGPAKTLGTGRLTADGASLEFAYPSSVFHDDLTYDATGDRWRLLIHADEAGKSSLFSDWTFTRAAAGVRPSACRS